MRLGFFVLLCACGGQVQAPAADAGAPDVADVVTVIDSGPHCTWPATQICGGQCVKNDTDHCGPACSVCKTNAPNMHATCDGDACSAACDAFACNGVCVPLDDPTNCGSCGRNCGSQSCSQGTCVPELVATGPVMCFALDDTNLYYGLTTNQVYVTPKGGGSTSLITSAGAESIALDSTNVYWTDLFALYTKPLAGGTISTLATGLLGGVIVDGGFAYGGGNAQIWEIPVTGGTPTTFSASIHFSGFALDATDIWVGGEGLVRISRATHAVTTVIPSTTNIEAIGVDAQSVYVATSNSIEVIAKTGTTMTPLASAPGAVTTLAVGDTDVFYVAGSTVTRVAKTGGSPVALAQDTVMTRGLALDAQYVYWADLKGVARTPR